MEKKQPPEFDYHHRKPKSRGGSNSHRNLSRVRRDEHEAFHKLFGVLNPYDIAEILNEIWIDPDYKLVVFEKQKTKKKHGRKRPSRK